MYDFMLEFKKMRNGYDLPPATTLAGIQADVQVLHVTKKTANLELLPSFAQLRYRSGHDLNDAAILTIGSATQITHFSANTYGAKELSPLSALINLVGLEITDNTKSKSVDWVGSLTGLQAISLSDFPATIDITTFENCKKLKYIWLSSNMGKPMRITSLNPLSGLLGLEKLVMKNVRVEDRKLCALHNLPNLIEIDVPAFFSEKEFIALAAALPTAKGQWLDIYKAKVGI